MPTGGLPDDARRVLEIRAAVGSASVKKAFAMRNRLSADDRMRDLFIHYGARTGRCVAEGEPVLVQAADGRVFECPIEQVALDHRVWDGAEWVSHEGVVSSGVREVISHDGVTATPEHLVYVSSDECVPLAVAQRDGRALFKGERPCPSTSTP